MRMSSLGQTATCWLLHGKFIGAKIKREVYLVNFSASLLKEMWVCRMFVCKLNMIKL